MRDIVTPRHLPSREIHRSDDPAKPITRSLARSFAYLGQRNAIAGSRPRRCDEKIGARSRRRPDRWMHARG